MTGPSNNAPPPEGPTAEELAAFHQAQIGAVDHFLGLFCRHLNDEQRGQLAGHAYRMQEELQQVMHDVLANPDYPYWGINITDNRKGLSLPGEAKKATIHLPKNPQQLTTMAEYTQFMMTLGIVMVPQLRAFLMGFGFGVDFVQFKRKPEPAPQVTLS